MRFVLITVASMVADISDACADSENQVPRFCWGGHILYQAYCPNVENFSEYTCVGGSSLGCACKSLYRAINGECVKLEECGLHTHKYPDIRSGTHKIEVQHTDLKLFGETTKIPTGTVPGRPKSTIDVNVAGDSNLVAATNLMKSSLLLELLMTSDKSWVRDQCLCLKSMWMADSPKGAERSLECYAYRNRLYVPHSKANLTGTKRLIKTTKDVEVTVGNWNTGGKTNVYITPAKRRNGCAISLLRSANGIADVDKSLFGLWNEYDVLVANTTCVTLTFTSLVDGKLHCMIWGTRSGEKIEENDCYNSSFVACGKLYKAARNRRHDPCGSYDDIDEITTKLAQKEEGIVTEP